VSFVADSYADAAVAPAAAAHDDAKLPGPPPPRAAAAAVAPAVSIVQPAAATDFVLDGLSMPELPPPPPRPRPAASAPPGGAAGFIDLVPTTSAPVGEDDIHDKVPWPERPTPFCAPFLAPP
jgi:hypothetical protein